MSAETTHGVPERPNPSRQLEGAVPGDHSPVSTEGRIIAIDPFHSYSVQFLIAILRAKSCLNTSSQGDQETAVRHNEGNATVEKSDSEAKTIVRE
jgi:hypothetical protein